MTNLLAMFAAFGAEEIIAIAFLGIVYLFIEVKNNYELSHHE